MEEIERSVLFHFPLLEEVVRGSGYIHKMLGIVWID